MADTKISMYLPPNVNPTQAAIAYGCRALPKLNEELQSDDLLTRQKALMALCDLMHDPEHVYTAISIGEPKGPRLGSGWTDAERLEAVGVGGVGGADLAPSQQPSQPVSRSSAGRPSGQAILPGLSPVATHSPKRPVYLSHSQGCHRS